MSELESTQIDNPSVWKQKALDRRLELKELNKRRKELYRSRENWKSKYLAEKQRADDFEKQLLAIKKKLNEILIE